MTSGNSKATPKLSRNLMMMSTYVDMRGVTVPRPSAWSVNHWNAGFRMMQ